MVNTNNVTRFFAAANGYNGFRSNFDKVFSPSDFRKLYVIKGGPGTGKSTLMRKISNRFLDSAEITEIYCSSDPKSLDGVIIKKNGVKIGIVDGTSPHTVEPIYPGAVEQIVNLGDSFDYNALTERSEHIIELNKIKKEYYNKAYSALNIAGLIHKYINDYIAINELYYKAEEKVDKVIASLEMTKTRLENNAFYVGAFCKDGYIFIENSIKKEILSIWGDGISEYIFMTKLKEKLDKNKYIKRVFTSAFSQELYDRIETERYIFTLKRDDKAIDSTSLFEVSDEYKRLKAMYDNTINEVKYAFENASKYHFKLEDIYSSCISFENHSDKYNEIVDEICSFSVNNRC